MFQTERKLLFLTRFFYITLLLIVVPLFFPRFEPGGRYLILVNALLAALLTGVIRRIAGNRLSVYSRALAGGLGLVAGLVVLNYLFNGISLDPSGLTGVLLGVSGLEMLLPVRLVRKVPDRREI